MGKRTDTLLSPPSGAYESVEGRPMLEGFKMVFNLSQEDFDIVTERVLPTLQDSDLADAMLCMLTYGIHCAYRDITGKEFEYPYERYAKNLKKA